MSSAIAVPPGQPQLKAAPTAPLVTPTESSTRLSTRTPEPAGTGPTRLKKDVTSPNVASEQATISLIRRVLIPHQSSSGASTNDVTSLTSELPPLTSSNAIDLQLYAILAVVVKEFVNAWYSKITPDHGFVEEVIHIVAHCSRAIEQRIRKIDAVTLLFDGLPSVITDHIQAYRLAKKTVNGSPLNLSYRLIYHGLVPHPALDINPPENTKAQSENERTYRQLLAQGMLAVLLPTEDLQNDALRILVGDVVADLILGQALADKICQGWFLHETICKVAMLINDSTQPAKSGDELHENVVGRLEKFGLLQGGVDAQDSHSSRPQQPLVVVLFWRTMQYGYLLYLFVRHLMQEARYVRSLPPRTLPQSTIRPTHGGSPNIAAERSPAPVLAFSTYTTVATLLDLSRRMPWLLAVFSFWQHILLFGSGRIAATNSVLDRILYRSIEQHVLKPTLIPQVLLQLRITLFPNNCLGPSAPPAPSIDEQREIKRRAAMAVRNLMPDLIAHQYYGTENAEQLLQEVERDILEPFEDVYANKHLFYSVLELVLIELVPELGRQGISELLAERGAIPDDMSEFVTGDA